MAGMKAGKKEGRSVLTAQMVARCTLFFAICGAQCTRGGGTQGRKGSADTLLLP